MHQVMNRSVQGLYLGKPADIDCRDLIGKTIAFSLFGNNGDLAIDNPLLSTLTSTSDAGTTLVGHIVSAEFVLFSSWGALADSFSKWRTIRWQIPYHDDLVGSIPKMGVIRRSQSYTGLLNDSTAEFESACRDLGSYLETGMLLKIRSGGVTRQVFRRWHDLYATQISAASEFSNKYKTNFDKIEFFDSLKDIFSGYIENGKKPIRLRIMGLVDREKYNLVRHKQITGLGNFFPIVTTEDGYSVVKNDSLSSLGNPGIQGLAYRWSEGLIANLSATKFLVENTGMRVFRKIPNSLNSTISKFKAYPEVARD